MDPAFAETLAPVTAWLAGRAVTPALGDALMAAFPPEGEVFTALAGMCRAGVRDGWLAQRGEDPLKWGRAIRPTPASHGFSVDVVRMEDVAGPHHAHPEGEIDMIVPLDETARFDGHGIGWLTYAPGSAHRPTVTGGAAIVLYLLPAGAIDFGAR